MVTGSAWRKNNRRELRHSLGRFLAIVAIVALGVGFFAGLKVAQPAMLRTGSQYVQKTELFDYRLVSTLGLTQEDADYFAGLDGVRAAEGARSVDLTAEFEDEGMTLKALTLSDAVNRPSLTAGRMPERADECLADADRFTEADLGKTLTVQAASVNDAFTQTAFTIVGLAETPLYLGAERGTTSLGGGTLNGFVLLQPEAFAMDYFTEIYLLLDGTQGTDLYSDAYDAAVDAVRPALTAALKERAQKRYDDIIDEARDALSKAQKEYDDGLAEYQERRAQTEQELADARTQLDDGAQQLEYNRARLTQAESQLAGGEKELEAGQKEYDEGLAAFTQAKQDALDQLDAAQAQIDAAQKQLDDSGILVQYEALQITRRQLTERLASQEPGSAEALLTQGLIDATDLLLRQFEQSEAYQGYLQLQQAQAELDAKRSEAMQTLNEKQAELDAAKQKLEDGKKQLENSRSEIAAGWAAVNAAQAELEQGVAKVFPLFFFAVAALVCITTMTRMIDEQRTQIGTLKALGYSDGTIAWKYMSYSGGAALLGCALGFALGTWIFPLFIWMGYSMLYDFAPIVYVFDGWLLIISVLAALACSAGVTWLSCHAELRENPANLMRPKTPKAGKRILLEYIPFVWNRLSFLHKVSIRNIVRYKKRLFMMLLGVGGCTALIVAGLGLRDSISTVVDDQFRGVTHYQIAVTFVSPMDEAQQQAFREKYADEMTQCIFVHAAAYEARTSSGINKVNVIATDDPAITQAIDLHENGRTVAWPQQGVLLDAALARDTGVSVGETLPVSVDDTTSVDLPVAGTFENYVYHYAYMTAETYRDLFGADCEYSTAYILTDGDAYALGAALSSNSRVASVTVSEALQDIVDNTMKSLDYIVGLVVVCACALALVVLFNLCNISITERVREIATVKVLGFYHRETLNYVFREILLLTFCGALVGLPAGWALHRFIMQNIRISLVSFHIHVTPLSYALAFAATLLLAVAVCLCLIRKIDRISMAESLKSIE